MFVNMCECVKMYMHLYVNRDVDADCLKEMHVYVCIGQYVSICICKNICKNICIHMCL